MTSRISNLTVEEYTTPCPFAAEPLTSISEIRKTMQSEGIRHMPILSDSGEPLGIISDRDLRVITILNMEANLTADDVMSREPFTAHESDSLEDVTFELSKRKIGSAIILDKVNKVVGIFTSTDALNALVEVLRGEASE